jgi:hypothetical protein
MTDLEKQLWNIAKDLIDKCSKEPLGLWTRLPIIESVLEIVREEAAAVGVVLKPTIEHILALDTGQELMDFLTDNYQRILRLKNLQNNGAKAIEGEMLKASMGQKYSHCYGVTFKETAKYKRIKFQGVLPNEYKELEGDASSGSGNK